MKKNKSETPNPDQMSEKEVLIVAPLGFVILLPLLFVPWISFSSLYEGTYEPYIQNAPVIYYLPGDMFVLCLTPFLLIMQVVPPIAFMKVVSEMELSPYQHKIGIGNLIKSYIPAVVIGSLASLFLINPLVKDMIMDKGYEYCPKLDHWGLVLHERGYVVDPALCVPKDNLPLALERYQKARSLQ